MATDTTCGVGGVEPSSPPPHPESAVAIDSARESVLRDKRAVFVLISRDMVWIERERTPDEHAQEFPCAQTLRPRI